MTLNYILRRVAEGIVVLIIVTILVFLAMRLLPGDPILIFVTAQDVQLITPELMDKLYAEYGLDKPLVVQYFNWLGQIFTGNLGKSIHLGESVTSLIAARLPVSFIVAIPSFILAGIFGVLLGTIAGLNRGKTTDTVVTSLANFGISVPNFWLGILLIYVFGIHLKWLPVQGYTPPFEDFGLFVKKLIMPVFVIAIWGMAFFARQTRSSILEVLRQDYIRTAWAKGLKERIVVIRHALKNAFIPVITVMGMSFVLMIAGQVIIENVFSIPGLGRLLVTAIFGQDYQLVQAGVLVLSVLVVLTNLFVDIAYAWLDPRIRYN
jgi:peptide/nickel transport system permease protein